MESCGVSLPHRMSGQWRMSISRLADHTKTTPPSYSSRNLDPVVQGGFSHRIRQRGYDETSVLDGQMLRLMRSQRVPRASDEVRAQIISRDRATKDLLRQLLYFFIQDMLIHTTIGQ